MNLGDPVLDFQAALRRLDKSSDGRMGQKPSAGTFLCRLANSCKRQNYMPHHFTHEDPDVVLLGDYHPGGISWFVENLEAILTNAVKPGDAIFLEGAEGEVRYDLFDVPDSPIYQIKDRLAEMEVRTFCNDSSALVEHLETLLSNLPKDFQFDRPELPEIVEAWRRVNDQRDSVMVRGDFG